MGTAAPRMTASYKLALSALTAFVLSIGLALVVGISPAYAGDNMLSAAEVTTPTPSSDNPSVDTAPSTTVSTGSTTNTDTQSSSAAAPTSATPLSSTSITSAGTQSSNAPSANTNNLTTAEDKYSGDNGTDPLYMGLVPNSPTFFDYSDYSLYQPDDENKPYTASSFQRGNHSDPPTPYTRDKNNAAHVYYEVNAGQAVDLEGWFDYLRIGNTIYWYDHNMSDANPFTLPTTPTNQYFMFSWYEGEVPLPQGVYYTDLDQFQQATGTAGQSGSTQNQGSVYYNYDISPLAFVTGYASYYGDYSVANRIKYSDDNLFTKQADGTYTAGFPIASTWDISSWGFNYFEQPGMHVFALQATYVQEFEEPGKDANGNDITVVKHILCASNPVYFHILVKDTAVAKIEFTATDNYGRSIDISDSKKFGIIIDKQYMPIDPNPYYSLSLFMTRCASGTNSYDRGNAGKYKIQLSSIYNRFEQYLGTFDVTDTQIASGTVIIPIQLTAKTQSTILHTVEFVDEDGTTPLYPAKQYFEGTPGIEVDHPNTDPTKADDANNKYLFSHWEVVWNGTTYEVGSPMEVLADMVYKAVYRAIPKNNVTSVGRVYASGGLFSMQKPDSVSSYAIAVGTPTGSTKTDILQAQAARIGKDIVAGIFEVDLYQYNNNGTTDKLVEGIGSMTISFPADGLADGTKVRVLQVHKNLDGTEATTIEHTGLTVQNGKVDVTLNGLLSTFIITAEDTNTENKTTDDPTDNPTNNNTPSNDSSKENTANNGSSETNKNSGTEQTPERVNEALSTSGELTGIAAGEIITDDNAADNMRAAAKDAVKTGVFDDDNDPAETGDTSAILLLALGTLAAIVAAAYALRRRVEE